MKIKILKNCQAVINNELKTFKKNEVVELDEFTTNAFLKNKRAKEVEERQENVVHTPKNIQIKQDKKVEEEKEIKKESK